MTRTVILFSGKMGSGKTTVSNWVSLFLRQEGYHVRIFKFADVLYELHQAIINILQPYGYKPETKWGSLLQYLGTEFGRKTLDENIWVKILKQRVDDWMFLEHEEIGSIAIIDDMRFKNEWLEDLKPEEVIRIRLECPEEIRKERCENWRPNTQHPSEIDLDDWVDKFDLVIDTRKSWPAAEADILDYLCKKLDISK